MTTQTPQTSLGPLTKRSPGRPKGYEPFSTQSDSKRSSTLTKMNKLIDEDANGDATGLILAYLESRHAKTHFSARKFDRSFELARINKLLRGFNSIYSKIPDYNKIQYVTIFRNAGLTRKEVNSVGFSISNRSWANAGKHITEFGVGAPRPTQNKRHISADVVNKIKETFERDEISYVSSYRTIKLPKLDENTKQVLRDDNNKIIKEIVNVRFLNVSKNFVWQKFRSENPDAKIARAKFYELIPQEYKDGRRETDKCPVCHYGKKITAELTKLEGEYHANCMNCDKTKCHVEDDLSAEQREELKILRENITIYNQHTADNQCQRNNFNSDMTNLQPGQALFVLDFKANMKVNQHRVQLNHEFYQQHSRSLLGVAVVLPDQVCKDRNIHKVVYFDILSENLNHNAHFVITALKSVFEHEFIINLNLTDVTFWMDGAGHFKNGQLAKYFSDLEVDNDIKVKWNHFTEYHGKSLCDGRFSMITRFIQQELQSSAGSIETTDDLIRVIQHRQASSSHSRISKRPITTFQLKIDIPVIETIDSYLIKNIKSFHAFVSNNGQISCLVNSNDENEVLQPRKIEQIPVSTKVRNGYQTKQFDVDTLFNGLTDKQAKQNHFRNNGTISTAPKSKRKQKNNTNEFLSQPAPSAVAEYDEYDFYSQGSAISDSEDAVDRQPDPIQNSAPPPLANTNESTSQLYEIVSSAPESDSLIPLLQQINDMVTSGQIPDLNSLITALYQCSSGNSDSTNSIDSAQASYGPLTRILRRAMVM